MWRDNHEWPGLNETQEQLIHNPILYLEQIVSTDIQWLQVNQRDDTQQWNNSTQNQQYWIKHFYQQVKDSRLLIWQNLAQNHT
jgi:hypothetical protein